MRKLKKADKIKYSRAQRGNEMNQEDQKKTPLVFLELAAPVCMLKCTAPIY